ncbi:hypothetical protein [Limibacterium fermenti]|uniref:hypothetical protein n=1 Tax=Limibacterium fermenti TaxID=3229863 RepID=UPI003A7222FC
MKVLLKLSPVTVKVSVSKSIMVHEGSQDAQYKIALPAAEVEWDLDWVKIRPEHGMEGIRIKPRKLEVHTGFGAVTCTPVVNYPFELYTGKGDFFRIKDRENLLNTGNPFEYLIFEYDIEADIEERKNVDFVENYTFGRNVILEENEGKEEHAYKGRSTFESLYPDCRHRFITTLDEDFEPEGGIENIREGEILNAYGANLLLRPYYLKGGNLAIADNVYQNPEILKIICHGGNEYRRLDVTRSENEFLLNTVCVGAIADEKDLQSHDNTSYGYGMEFYENTGTKLWNDLYPEKKFKSKVFSGTLNTTKDTITLGGDNWPPSDYEGIEAGADIFLRSVSGEEFAARIRSVDNPGEVLALESSVTDFPGSRCDVLVLACLGSLWCPYRLSSAIGDCGSQSFAVNVTGAKFRMIQDRTGASWGVCRHAARQTASLSVYDPLTDTWTTNWDMRRGFGIINTDAAVEYILKNTGRKEFRDSSAVNLPKVPPFLEFKDYGDNHYCAVKYVKRMFAYFSERLGLVDTNLLDGYYFEKEGDDRVRKTDVIFNYMPVYEVKGTGGFQVVMIRHSTFAKQGERFTLSCFARMLSEEPEVAVTAALRMTHGDGSDEQASNSQPNVWEKLVVHYEAGGDENNQIQIVPAYNAEAVTQFCCVKLEAGWKDDPVFVPGIDEVMR